MPINNPPIISLNDISFGYTANEMILKNISLTVNEGEYVGVIGPNGGGKTTLIKIMLGLIKPLTGMVKLFGEDIKKFKNWPAIGYVPQKAVHFDAHFPATVAEVVAMGRYGARGLFRPLTVADRRKTLQSLNEVGMLDYKDRLLSELSGGQQQRVFIARALATDPKIIFLDEPTAGVDVHMQEQFYKLLKHLNQELGVTLILVSHDIDVVAHEVTKLACINQTLIYHGSPKEFVARDYLAHVYGKEMKFILHNH